MCAYLNKRFWKAICEDCLAKSVGRKKTNTLFTNLGRSVCKKRPRAQFFPIRSSRLVNNIYVSISSVVFKCKWRNETLPSCSYVLLGHFPVAKRTHVQIIVLLLKTLLSSYLLVPVAVVVSSRTYPVTIDVQTIAINFLLL